MYQLNLNNMTPGEFLSHYWQKKPLLIKQGFNSFIDPLSPDELAGMAMEECIESRIITNHNNDWQAHHGPFTEFELLTDTNATLLVQAVDHWHQGASELLNQFDFIPNWRIDDLMISYSSPQGGVGPHLDQYDVFIIQGQGKRHWRVGLPNQKLKQNTACESLLQVEQFEAIIDIVLEPGDILYIPPGAPHEGYAIENSLNYSVGFRAPDQKDLISSFADHLIDHDLGEQRYQDADLKLRDSKGEIKANEINNIKQLLSKIITDDKIFNQWLGENLSQPKHELDIVIPDTQYTADQVITLLQTPKIVFNRIGGLRAVYQVLNEIIILSINGTNFELPLSQQHNVCLLTDLTSMSSDQLKSSINSRIFINILTTLINEGYWYLE